jgi:ribosome-binding factor A
MQKIEKELRELVSTYLVQNQSGQSQGLICIAQIIASPDLRQAKVYISQIGKDHVDEELLESIQNEAPEIQRFVHSRLRTRYCPKLLFFNDDTVATSIRMDSIFSNLNKQED